MKIIIFLILLHSLWQGLALAALTSVIMLAARRSSPALRYRLLTGSLLLFTISIGLTALNIAAHHAGNAVQETIITTATPGSGIFLPGVEGLGLGRNLKIGQYLSDHAALIVWLWLALVCIKTFKMVAGLRIAYRMKRQQVYDAGHYWQNRVRELSTQLGITQQVRIMQSALAKTPLVIGHFKPLILLPLGLVTNLTTAEVEAILCHELAHIRRKDFLVNLLQSVLEVIFFFNPAIFWLNRLIRTEREHCCDDLALGASVGIRDYINALISSHTFKSSGPAFAMAWAGTQSQLLHRVSRILHQKHHHRPVRILLVLLLLVSVVVGFAFLKNDSSRTIVWRTRVENEAGTTKEEQIVHEDSRMMDAEKVCKPEHPATNTTEQTENTESIAGSAAQQDHSATLNANAQVQAEEDARLAEDAKKIAARAQVLAEKARTEAEKVRFTTAVAKKQPQENVPECRPAPFTEEDGRNLHNELAADGLIRKQDQISYLLNSKELVINHVKQSEDIHQKYAAKYVKYAGRSILYNYEHTSAH